MEDDSYVQGHGYSNDHSLEVIPNESALSALNIKTDDAVGKKIKLKITITPVLLANPNLPPITQEQEYTIVGVLNDQSSPFVYIPLEKFQLMGVTNYTNAKVKVKNQSDVAETTAEINYLGYKTSTLQQTMTQINQFFQIFQLILVSFGAVAVLVASIGMFNTLTISLLEKTKEISFMKILGTTSWDIWRLFIAEAIIIGIVGGVLGTIFGLVFGTFVNAFIAELAKQTGNQAVQIFYTPIDVTLTVLLAIIIASFVTGIYPSLRASRIDPLKSIRYE
jgi:ABC-type lipoprotein release transport system permease subunit